MVACICKIYSTSITIISMLWTDRRILQEGERRPDQEGRMRWQDRVLFGQTFSDWTEVEHPEFGTVLVGGGTKYASRTPPPFMLEEEAHRNFAFTAFHAAETPKLRVNDVVVADLGGGLWQVDVEIANDRLIPTRTARAAQGGIGRPDILGFTPAGGTELVVAGPVRDRFAKDFEPVPHRPERLLVETGIPGRGLETFRYLLRSDDRPQGVFEYDAEKARDLTWSIPAADDA